MFWKIIRWGGTAIVIAILLLAAILGTSENQLSPTPTQTQPEAKKDFNL